MRLRTVVVFLAALAALSSASNGASDAPGNAAAPIENNSLKQDVSGKTEFLQYCALCHGADGRGMGPLTDEDAMKKSATDLTQLAKRNGGSFPFSKVADTIRDGRSVSGHTPSRMMAWAKIFGADGDPVRAKAIIFEVTRYVEGLQE